MKLAALLFALVPLAGACVGNSDNSDKSDGTQPTASKRNAARAFTITSSLLGNLDLAGRTSSLVSGNVNFSEPCASGGSLSIDGTFEESDDGTTSSYDVLAGFDACATGTEALDGEVHWTQEISAAGSTESLTGTLLWTGVDGSASCAFDLAISIDDSGVTYSGTVCGFDVEELEQP